MILFTSFLIRENENFFRFQFVGVASFVQDFSKMIKKEKKGVDIFVAEGEILVPLEERNLAGQPISLSRS